MQRTFKDIVQERIPPQIGIAIAFAVLLVAGYFTWSILTGGTIVVTAPYYQTEVYIDGMFIGSSREAAQKMSFGYPVGSHEVIISKPGFWPWMQDVTVEKKEAAELKPFLLQKTLKSEAIPRLLFNGDYTSENPEYAAALKAFDSLSVSNSVASALTGTNIKNIRSADLFPGRDDVLLVAANNMIFVIDAKNTTPRNFAPVYSGTAPEFLKLQDDTLLVKDGNQIFRLKGLVPSNDQ